MMKPTSVEIQLLVYAHLLDCQFSSLAEKFLEQTGLASNLLDKVGVKAGTLSILLQKGLIFTALEKGLDIESSVKDVLGWTEDAREGVVEVDEILVTPVQLPFEPATTTMNVKRQASTMELLTKKTRKEEPVRVRPREISEKVQDIEAKTKISNDVVTTLTGHNGIINDCQWNPKVSNVFATCAKDGTARIWDVGGPTGTSRVIVNAHPTDTNITTLAWSPDGQVLATGSQDRHVRLWSFSAAGGSKMMGTVQNDASVVKVSFTPGTALSRLLVSCTDGNVHIYKTESRIREKKLMLHQVACTDHDWRNETSFASAAADGTIVVVKHAETERVFAGHVGAITQIRWDPTRKLLASAGEDGQARVWTMDPDASKAQYCQFILAEHTASITSLEWSPRPLGKDRVLATASLDHSVRLWNAQTGSLLALYNKHSSPVNSLAFDISGRLLASGSVDGQTYFWAVAQDGPLLKEHKSTSSISKVQWRTLNDPSEPVTKLAVGQAEGLQVITWQ